MTDEPGLRAVSNTNLKEVQFMIENAKTGERKSIASGQDVEGKHSWKFDKDEEGEWIIQAVRVLPSGDKIMSETIPFKVYLGQLYSAKPVVVKDEF